MQSQARSQGFEKGSANFCQRQLLLSNKVAKGVAKGVCAGGDAPLLQSGALEVLDSPRNF
ncbi:hypothetical protein DPMN_182911 [Dreissena polymorpha]|uniref:Uncharacterized protein n=1 Tax=Dreissena polymorpha TaxID=45954 RepID=A0A9D4I516_DREPO|nr:hypothetical protein DPMN_182911 [Dreissena polymorpha]